MFDFPVGLSLCFASDLFVLRLRCLLIVCGALLNRLVAVLRVTFTSWC